MVDSNEKVETPTVSSMKEIISDEYNEGTEWMGLLHYIPCYTVLANLGSA